MSIVQGADVSSFFAAPSFVGPNWESTLGSVVVGSGEDTVAVVITGAPRLPVSVKLGATTMTKAVSQADNFAHVYYLTGVSAGTYSVVVEFTSGISWGITAVPLAGVDQTTPVGDTDEGSGFGTSRSLSLTTVSGDYVLGGISVEVAAATITSGQDDIDGGTGNSGLGDCTVRVQSDAATGTTTPLSWTHSSGWSYAAAAVFQPASTPSGPSAAALADYYKRHRSVQGI